MTVKERLIQYLLYKNISQGAFEKRVGLGNGYINNIARSPSDKVLQRITQVEEFSDLNLVWLRMGEGEMLKSREEEDQAHAALIRLLPISAYGGSLNNFVVSVKDSECERIVSPIKDVDFAITVAGDSMAPEFPNGSQILVKKIDEKQFIEWGKAYVLDTSNGTVLKILNKSEKDGYVRCTSLNPDHERYAPFDVPMDVIYGVYRVMFIMAIK
jgi:hypothetical protein